MSEKRLPPHLQIAESVTEEEYKSAMWQSKVVLTTALLTGMVLSIPMIVLVGYLEGVMAAGFSAILVERSLHFVFKDARKARTERIKRYKELRIYRAYMNKN
jgi:hypothetical protein